MNRVPRPIMGLVLLLLTGIAVAATRLASPLRIETEPPVEALPPANSQWTGQPVLFCQSDQCGRSWLPDEARLENNQQVCPACGAALDEWSLGERRSLSADTLLLRRRYTHPVLGSVILTLVVSPPNVNSIHRPLTCIFGQGYQITRSNVITLPLTPAPPLPITLVELSRHIGSPDSSLREIKTHMAYWFMDRNRRIADHTTLTLELMRDRLLRGTVSRWAYVTITSEWNTTDAAFRRQLEDLLAAIHAELLGTPHHASASVRD